MNTSPKLKSVLLAGVIALLGSSYLVAAQSFSFDRPSLTGTTPQPEVRALILKQEAELVRYVLAGHQAGLDKLLADGVSYLHENGRVSNKEEFFRDYLSVGYIDARHKEKEPMRQFGSLITTVSYGYFRLKTEGEYPERSVVTHLWCKTAAGDWVLVHRSECHDGNAINTLLPQEGGPVNLTHVAQPSLEVARIISKNDSEWCRCMVENDAVTMDKLMDESVQYVHVIDLVSDKKRFMWEQSTGFTDSNFKGTVMRQFGNVVISLHNAHYRHTDRPDQSRSQVMHCWFNFGNNDWRMVSRHGARFLPY